MPDLSMCNGELTPMRNHVDERHAPHVCPMRADCYRHTAAPSLYRQSYFAAPYDARKGTCARFIPSRFPPPDDA